MTASDGSQPTPNASEPNQGLFVPTLKSVAQRYSRWGWVWAWVGVELLGNLMIMGGIMGFLLGERDEWTLSAGGILGATVVFVLAAMPQYAVFKRFLYQPARMPWYAAVGCGYWLVVGFWWLRSHDYLHPFQPEMVDIAGVSIIMTLLHCVPPTIALTGCMTRPWLWGVAHVIGALGVIGPTLIVAGLISTQAALGIYIGGTMFAYPMLTALVFYEGMRRINDSEG